MQVIRNIIIWLAAVIIAAGCIEPFTPEIKDYERLLVINGRITDREGYHYVEVSRSTSYNDPKYDSEKGSVVKVYDDRGNVFQYTEYLPGNYRCWIGQEYLSVNTRYKVEVVTRDGNIYVSDFEAMEPCPDIERIYYEVKVKEADNPIFIPTHGIQLYIDTKESEKERSNLRWEIDETWEYHSAYLLNDYYDGEIHYVVESSDSLYYCWKSSKIRDIFTMSTRNYSSKKINKGSLAYVSDNYNKLQVKYSALVKQHSLSDSAYEYWSNMQQNLQEGGGLYESQPIRITGNIYNINNSEEVVLGYFWASSIKEKRFFFKNIGEIPYQFSDCQPNGFTSEALDELLKTFTKNDFPVFLINLSGFEQGPWDYAEQGCFDCRKNGGTLVKPDFWQ